MQIENLLTLNEAIQIKICCLLFGRFSDLYFHCLFILFLQTIIVYKMKSYFKLKNKNIKEKLKRLLLVHELKLLKPTVALNEKKNLYFENKSFCFR